MTILYKIRLKHTKEVLKDFIKFSYKINHPKSAFRLLTFGTCCILIGFVALGYNTFLTFAGFIMGAFLLIMLLLRNQIAFVRLAGNDKLYQEQNDILLEFGEAKFFIQDSKDENLQEIKYGEIHQVFKDKKNYYLLINNEDLQILPYDKFELGKAAEFATFIERKIKKAVIDMSIPFKERLKMMNTARKQAEALHDQRLERRKKEKKKNS